MSLFGPCPFDNSSRLARKGLKSTLYLIVALIAGLGTTAHGYVLGGQSWPGGTNLVLQMSLGNPVVPLQDGSTSWNEAAAPAATMWDSVLQRVQITQVVNPGAIAVSGDHLNSVVFAFNIFGQAFGGSTLAVTYYRYSGSTMMEVDTLFNRGKVFDSYRGPLQFPGPGPAIIDMRRVFLHELGHALGLNHPDTGGQHVTAVMNSIMSNQEVLSPDDIAGGQFLYGAPSSTPTPTPTPTPFPSATPSAACHLMNVSTRLKIGVSENVLIGGFIIRGTQSKKLILRAIGPSLGAWGVPNAMADPVLELHGSSGGIIAANNDWQTGAQMSEIQTSGLAPAHSAESALIVTLSPGNYTAVVGGVGGGQGIGLVEAYEFDGNTTRFINISTRGRVGAADEPMIGGFIVQGGVAKRVIIRALGPSLAGGPSPVANALVDPFLELHDGNGNALAANDDWSNGSQAGEIVGTGLPPANNSESAIVRTLGPGNYTAVVRGVNNTTGVGLVEVYDLDPVILMKLLRSLLLLVGAGLALASVRATTVIPPTFDQLVSDAELIFEGTVTDVRSQWAGVGADRHIMTHVTFQVEDAIKGAPGKNYVVQMLGGTVDGETLEVADVPKFKVGDRDILFVERNGTQFMPLVGIMHGRFHVQTDAGGRDVVAKDNGAFLADVAKLGQDEKAAITGPALSVADFKSAIRRKLSPSGR